MAKRAAWYSSAFKYASGNEGSNAIAPATGVIGSEQALKSEKFIGNQAEFFFNSFPKASEDWDLMQSKKRDMPELTRVIENLTFGKNWGRLSVILPPRNTSALRLAKYRRTFMPTLAQKAPERTRPRTVQSKETMLSAFLDNYQLGFSIPFSALSTPAGKEVYMAGIQQLRIAFGETMNMMQLNALQTAFTPWRQIKKRFGGQIEADLNGKKHSDIIANDKTFFMFFQKNSSPWELFDTLVTHLMESYRGEGDKYVTHKKLKMYTSHAIARQTEFSRGGNRAVSGVITGPNFTYDTRNNEIITVDSFVGADGEAPLDLLKRYVKVGEFNPWVDLDRNGGGDGVAFLDKHLHSAIFDFDNDAWAVISTETIINGSNRYDLETGRPIGLNSSEMLARHPIKYDGQETDSYHYLASSADGDVLVPAEVMGHLNKKHVTINQIFNRHVRSVTDKLPSIEGFLGRTGKTVLENGMEVLRLIESVRIENEAKAYLELAIAQNTASYKPHTPMATSRFAPLLSTAQHGQNVLSGWDLPRSTAAVPGAAAIPAAVVPKVPAPIGYGSASGFLAIAKAYDSVTDDAAFLATYGFPRDIAGKATEFIRAIERYMGHVQPIYMSNPFLDANSAAPWWQSPTSLHTFWDNVVTPHARLPFLAKASKTTVRGDNNALVAGLRNASQINANYIQDQLVGAASIVAANADAPVTIDASVNVRGALGANDAKALYDLKQGHSDAATTAEALYARLPTLARVAFGSAKEFADIQKAAGAPGPGTRFPVQLAPTKDTFPQNRRVAILAHNVLLSALFSSIISGGKTKEREVARSAILAVLSLVDISGMDTEAGAIQVAKRILTVYSTMFQGPLGLTEERFAAGEEAALTSALDNFDSVKFIESFGTQASRITSQLMVRDERGILAAKRGLERIVASASQGDDKNFLTTPLLYSPEQLVSFTAGSDFALTDPSAIGVPLSAGALDDSKNALKNTGGNPRRFAALPSSLRSLNVRNIPSAAIDTQVSTLSQLLGQLSNGETAYPSRASSGFNPDRAVESAVAQSKKRRAPSSGAATPASKSSRQSAGQTSRAPIGIETDRFLHLYGRLSDLFTTANFVENWNAVSSATNRSIQDQWTAKLYLVSPNNAHVLCNWAAHDVLVPVSALIFRFLFLGTYSIIKCKAGCGETPWGNGMLTYCADTSSNRTLYTEYTMYMTSLVDSLPDVFQADNVYCDEYLGGGGVVAVGSEDVQNTYYAHGGSDPSLPSMFISLEPYNAPKYDAELSITGDAKDMYGRYGITLQNAKQRYEWNFAYLNAMYGFQEATRVDAGDSLEDTNFEPGSSAVICYRGATAFYNRKENDYVSVMEATGFFDTDMYGPGLKKLIEGKIEECVRHTYIPLVRY